MSWLFRLARLVKRWFRYDEILVINYYAFISAHQLHLRGRIIEDNKIVSLPTDNWFRNFVNLAKRILSHEVAHARVDVIACGERFTIHSNEEGFYEGTFRIQDLCDTVRVEVNHPRFSSVIETEVIPTILHDDVQYGVISDIDDTILVTGVVSWFKWRLLLNTLFLNPQKRKSFKNVSTFYRKLASGGNPFFYISNSPWNLFDYLKVYLQHNKFPNGFLLLRDYNFLSPKSSTLEKQNKYKEIMKAFTACPDIAFVLIGDAGEVDVDIYRDIAAKYPERVRAIYIRSVDDRRRMKRVRKIAKLFTPVPLMVFDHTVEMEDHLLGLQKADPQVSVISTQRE
ncbi:MAG: phosphatase domain-containing protein [Bacteroidota bacterium]